MMGLDPQALAPLTFNIGTGSIEKVSRIRDKYNLIESYTSDLVKQLTPIIENIVRKTVVEIMDSKLNQILTAQQTMHESG